MIPLSCRSNLAGRYLGTELLLLAVLIKKMNSNKKKYGNFREQFFFSKNQLQIIALPFDWVFESLYKRRHSVGYMMRYGGTYRTFDFERQIIFSLLWGNRDKQSGSCFQELSNNFFVTNMKYLNYLLRIRIQNLVLFWPGIRDEKI